MLCHLAVDNHNAELQASELSPAARVQQQVTICRQHRAKRNHSATAAPPSYLSRNFAALVHNYFQPVCKNHLKSKAVPSCPANSEGCPHQLFEVPLLRWHDVAFYRICQSFYAGY